MQKVKYKNLTWIYFPEPDADDVLAIQKKYHLHPLVIEEFSTPTLRPKATEYDNCLYLSIHIPLFDTQIQTTYPGEIDIVITKDALITSNDHPIYQLTDLFEKLKSDPKERAERMNQSPGALLRYIIEMLLESCFAKLDHISEKLDHIETEIFAGHEKEMVFEISVVKRDILNFRRTMKPQRSVLESLSQKDFHLIERELKPYFQDLIGTNIRIWNNLESAKETIESLEATNNSLLSNKLDMTMKVLTIFSAVLLPLTVYSNILAMSAHIPFGDNPYGFWIHMGIMFVIGAITVFIFKVRKWL
ncbi:MAG: magnesium transporter CorA family protein [Candidatus Pacebacteria bacterium]|nr:magnesium transporter CorA family protein [Candidatus Paceibacterota bacterium]